MTAGHQTDKIATLGCFYGITGEYLDNFGRRHQTSTATIQALLTAMGIVWEDPTHLEQEIARRRSGPWSRLLQPVQVVPVTPQPGQVSLYVWSSTPKTPAPVAILGELTDEEGSRVSWETVIPLPPPLKVRAVADGFRTRLELSLPVDLALGYYDLTLRVRAGDREEEGRSRLIVAPSTVYAPQWLAAGRRLWGFNLPLYALARQGDWGMGDFRTLEEMVHWAGSLGAAFVGINPLHALAPQPEADPSPYSPTSRAFLNPLYLDLETVPELEACREAQALVASPEFQALRVRLHEAHLVPYGEVHRLKSQALKLLYQTFVDLHGLPESPRTSRGREFSQFLAAKGDSLACFGQFYALAEFLGEGDWRRWPSAYQDPGTRAVADFTQGHPLEIGCHLYAQWLTVTQLAQVCDQARSAGLPVTLYGDLALGSTCGGFDTWAYRDLFALEAATGAPPDSFNPKGQDWGLPPLIPMRLRESGYQLFIDTLRANLPIGGMLRLDHVMGLFRLFWIPRGLDPAQGAYVVYPARELLAILALESVRRRALIIGEDLGTVPAYIRRRLGRTGILSYRVFYFERARQCQFLPPEDYSPQAMATVTTHDLPTLAGYWQGRDLALKRTLNLYPHPGQAEADAAGRAEDRQRLVQALRRRDLLPSGMALETGSKGPCPRAVRYGVLDYLARSAAALLEVRLEEVFGVTEQQNLPGTTAEHPNWRQKLPLTLEEMERNAEPARLAARFNQYRGRNETSGE